MSVVLYGFIIALLLAVSALALTFALWQGPFRKWLADRKLFLAAVAENSALGRQRGDKLDLMYINLGPDNREIMEALAKEYKKGDYEPVQVLPADHDGIVWIGVPYYATVKPWYLSEVHEEVLRDEERHGTMPLKVRTMYLPAALPEAKQKELNDRIAEARTDKNKKLRADELIYILALDHPESAEGYEYAHGIAIDYMFTDVWGFRNKVEYIGEQMFEFLNQAVRLVGAQLRFLGLTLDPEKGLEAELTRKVEPQIQAMLGLRKWEDEFGEEDPENKTGLKKLMFPIPAPTEQDPKAMELGTPKQVLEAYGVRLLRVRVRDLKLPTAVIDLLKKPIEARANAAAQVITADQRVKVAEKDADALRKKGAGERDYAKEIATGDQHRIAAWKADENQTPEAIQARLQQLGLETWQKGVSSPGDGKVVIVGAPGAPTDSITGATAALASVVKQVGGADPDKSKAPPATTPIDQASQSAVKPASPEPTAGESK